MESWKSRASLYSNITKSAVDFSCVSSPSVACEGWFSISGNSDARNRWSGGTAEALKLCWIKTLEVAEME